MAGGMWSNNIRKRARRLNNFTLAFVMIGLGVVAVGIFVVTDLRSTGRDVRLVYDRSVSGLDLIGELQYQTQEARRIMLYALTTNDTNLQIDYVDQSRTADARVAAMIDQHLKLDDSANESAISNRFKTDWAAYLKVRDDMIVQILEGTTGVATELDLSAGVPAFNKVRDDLQEIKRVHRAEAERQLNLVEGVSNRSLYKLIAVLCLTQLLAAFAVRMIQKGKMLQTVQQSESRLRDVVESINEGMFVIDLDGRVELWNEALERSTGRSRGEVLGRPLLEAFPHVEGSPLGRALVASAETGRIEALDDVAFGDDPDRVFEVRIFPFDGGTTVFINDVTERRLAERARRETEERYRTLVDNASIGIYRTTPDGKVLMANPAMIQILGYSSFEELAMRNLEDDEYEPDYQRSRFKRTLQSSTASMSANTICTPG